MALMRRLSFWAYGPLLPLLFVQGKRARARIPLLPEADGPRRGTFPGPGGRLSLAVLGESTAVGVGAANQEEALAFCLARALQRTRDLSVDLQVVGRTGANIARVRSELAPLVEGPVDAVVVVLGVNDTLELTRGSAWTSALHGLITDLRRNGAREVLFSCVPQLGNLPSLPHPTRSALGARAAYLDALLERACAVGGARHLPLHFHYRPELISRDGFHPSALGYAAWADAIARAW
jgi:lysophospholipase L1-like esterase